MGFKVQYNLNDEQLKQLVPIAGTSDKSQFNQWCKQNTLDKLLDLTGTQQKLSSKERSDYLKNLKLQLECWKMLNEQFPNMQLEERLQILNGNKNLPDPDLASKLNQKILCEFCHHEHNATTKICNERMCMCGLR